MWPLAITSTLCYSLPHYAFPYTVSISAFTLLIQAQYSFIHDALDEFLTCGDTSIAVTNIRVAMVNLSKLEEGSKTTGYHAQFEVRLASMFTL